MPDSTLPLIIDVNDPSRKGLLVSFDETARQETTPGQVRGDTSVSVYIRPVIASATDERPWDDDFTSGDTFTLAVGLPDEEPTAGTWSLGIQRAATSTITVISAASPTQITTSAAHGLTTGDLVVLTGTNSTPSLDGYVFPVTVNAANTFLIQAEVTIAGSAGTVTSYSASGMTALAFDISAANLQTALSAVSVALGYPALTVEKPSEGDYVVTWNAVSAVPPMVGSGGSLLPASQVLVNQIQEGAATTVALQIVQLRQLNVALANPATTTTAAGVTRTYTQTGSAVQNSIVKIAFDAPGTYGGLYSITLTAAGVTAACGTAGPLMTTQELGLVLANHPSINFQTAGVDDNIIVTTDGVNFFVQFVGTLSGPNSARTINDATVANPTVLTFSANHDFQNGDSITITNSTGITPSLNGTHTFTRTGATTGTIPVNVTVSSGESATAYSNNNNTLTVANVDLLAPLGVTGDIDFNTVNLFRAFANTDSESLTMTMSVKRTRTSGESRTILLTDVELFRSIINNDSISPNVLPIFATRDQVILGYKTADQFVVNDPDATLGIVSPVDIYLSDGSAFVFDNVDNDNSMKLTGANQVSIFIGGVQRVDFTTSAISSAVSVVSSVSFTPFANDGATLGTTALQFSDLFLASGAVVNFANGNAVVTHSSAVLTVSTGDLRVTTAGTNAASAVTVDGTQTLGNKTLTAPKFADLGFIADANANELIIFDTVTSAVNDVTFANAATGNNPTWTASGGDSNVGIAFMPKGTGNFSFGATSTQNTQVKLGLKNANDSWVNMNLRGSADGGMGLVAAGNSCYLASNAYFDGTNWRAYITGSSSFFGANGSAIEFYNAASVTAGSAFSLVNCFSINSSLRVTIYGEFAMPKTITAGGTTGNQTINKPSGSVNFAAAATTLTVTNSLCTANSVIVATVATNDATMKSVCAVAGAGSFVLTADAAATGETRVNWILTN